MKISKAEIRAALKRAKPYVYLSAYEHYDVPPSAAEKKRSDHAGENMSRAIDGIYDNPEDVYVVQINIGTWTGVNAVVYDAGHPDSALEAADDWAAGYYYDGDGDAMHDVGEGPVRVDRLKIRNGNGRGGGSGGALANALKGRK